MRMATMMLAVLAVAGVASAGLIVHVDPVAITYNAQNFTQYTVTVVGTDGDMMGGFDGRFDGVMYQIRAAGVYSTPTLSIGDPGETLWDYMTLEQIAVDSHMLIYASEVTYAQTPAENRNSTTNLGTYLAGALKPPDYPANGDGPMAFGFETFARSTNRPLAQIVVPIGQQVRMRGLIADQDGDKTAVDIILPEPATMGLLTVGGLLALVRRRRRA